MANGGVAVFEAVGRFGPLISEAQKAETALKRTSAAGRDIGKGIEPKVPKGGNVGKRADEFAGKMGAAGQKASLGMTLPLTLAGGAAVKAFASYEYAITSAGLKTGASAAELKAMGAVALKMGAETKFSALEAATALDGLGSAGLTAQESIDALPSAMNAAQASGSDLASTASLMAQMMNAFNIPAKDSVRVADVFASAANNSALSMESIGVAMASAGQMGATANQSLEDVTATIANLVNQGIPAASAGTAVSQAMMSLKAPTSEGAGLLNAFGIEVRDAAGKMLPLPTILKNLDGGLNDSNKMFKAFRSGTKLSTKELDELSKLTGRSPKQLEKMRKAMTGTSVAAKDQAMNILFGVEGMKAMGLSIAKGKPMLIDLATEQGKMTQLTAGLTKVMGKDAAAAFIKAHTAGGKFSATGADAVQALSAMSQASKGSSAAAGKVFQQTTQQKFDNAIGSMETMAITLIDTVKPALGWFADTLASVVNKLTELSKVPFVGPIVVGLLVLMAALGPVMIILSKIITAFRTVGALGGKLRGPKGGSKGGGGASTVSTNPSGVQQVGWSKSMPVHLTGKNGTTTHDSAGKDGKSKPGTAGAAGKNGSVTPSVSGRPDASSPVIRGKDKTPKKPGLLSRAAAGAPGRAAGAAAGGALAVALTGGDAGEAAKAAGVMAGLELAVEGLGAVGKKVAPHLKTAAKAVGGFGVDVVKAVGGGLKKVGPALARGGGAVAKVIAKVVEKGASLAQKAKGAVGGLISSGKEKLQGKAEDLAAKGMAKAKPMLAKAGKVAMAGLSNAGGALKTMGQIGAKWVWMGVQSLLGAAKMALAWIIGMGPIGWIIAAVIALVAVIILNWGKIAPYVSAAWDWIKAKAVAFWNWIKPYVMVAIQAVITYFKTYMAILKGVWQTAWNVIKAVFQTFWDGLKLIFDVAWAIIKGVFDTAMALLHGDWQGAWDAISGVVSTVFGKIEEFIGAVVGRIGGVLKGIGDAIGGVLKGLGLIDDHDDPNPTLPAPKVTPAQAAQMAKDHPKMPAGWRPDGFRRGGLIPGSGPGDKVPILAEAGEFMLTRDAVKRIGIPALSAANRAGGGNPLFSKPKMAGLLQASEARAVGSVRRMTGVSAGLSAQAPGVKQGGKGERTVKFETTIINPAPEAASDSLGRTYSKIAYLGLDAKETR